MRDRIDIYRDAPEVAILDILDAVLEITARAVLDANPHISSQAPYWAGPTLGPAYALDGPIVDLQAAINDYRRAVIETLPPDPPEELGELDAEAEGLGGEQLDLPF